ncbi:hypothetical protein JL108_04715 [Aeromicrobium sp. YIM 150415]|uniref:DoxX family protein n=1 Tax=Aeromicrobium sp. YIM 150415 TaxID=2803912 RepID=UPI0019639DF2|nr:hypothetical protein [Aeromicrobium sp. YIM 150415]MBM9462741.1 hypothetical protein [Aeromicrobium sp. YIM 150415]
MRKDTMGLVALLAGAGVVHFVKPEPFARIVPEVLPAKTELVYASGAAELVCAGLLALPRTRRFGGLAAAGLLAAVFPANVQMAVDVVRSPRASTAFKIGTVARLPLQWPLIRAALRARS